MAAFLEMMVPSNIFTALAEGRTLQILFFSIVFGVMVGLTDEKSRQHFLDLTDLMFKVFVKTIGIALYVLPIGLFSIMASQISRTGPEILSAMTRFVVLIYVVMAIVLAIGILVMAALAKISPFVAFKSLQEAFIVSFATATSFAAMPSILDSLENTFSVPRDTANLLVPLSSVICRNNLVMLYTLGSVFMAQLYGRPLGLTDLLVILLGSVLAALGGAGTPQVVAISMISVTLAPLGLPTATAVILLMAINPVIDQAVTVMNVCVTSAATVVIHAQGK